MNSVASARSAAKRDFAIGRVRFAIRKVLVDSPLKQEHVLADVADRSPERLEK